MKNNNLTQEMNEQIKALSTDDLKQLVWDLAAFGCRDDQAFAYEGSFTPPAFKDILEKLEDDDLYGLIRDIAHLAKSRAGKNYV